MYILKNILDIVFAFYISPRNTCIIQSVIRSHYTVVIASTLNRAYNALSKKLCLKRTPIICHSTIRRKPNLKLSYIIFMILCQLSVIRLQINDM